MNIILAVILGIFIAHTFTMLVAIITNENDEKVYFAGTGIWFIIFPIVAKIITVIGLWYMHHFVVGFVFVDNDKDSWETFYINKRHLKRCNLDSNAPKHLKITFNGKDAKSLPYRWEYYKGINDRPRKGRRDLKEYLL